MAVTFQWDREDLVMDNTETLTESVKWMSFGITVELALNMGWIKYRTAAGNEPHDVIQGPNLLLVPKDKKGPKADFTEERFYDGSVFRDYPNGFQGTACDVGRKVTGMENSRRRCQVLSNMYQWR